MNRYFSAVLVGVVLWYIVSFLLAAYAIWRNCLGDSGFIVAHSVILFVLLPVVIGFVSAKIAVTKRYTIALVTTFIAYLPLVISSVKTLIKNAYPFSQADTFASITLPMLVLLLGLIGAYLSEIVIGKRIQRQ